MLKQHFPHKKRLELSIVRISTLIIVFVIENWPPRPFSSSRHCHRDLIIVFFLLILVRFNPHRLHHPILDERRTTNLEFVVDFADDADRFVGQLLFDYFGSAVRALLQTKPEEDGVGHLDENIVHAIDVDASYASTSHIVDKTVLLQRCREFRQMSSE